MYMTEVGKERFEKAKRYLRLFMRDTPELNRLIRKQESDPTMYEFAIEMAISEYNTVPPVSVRTTIDNYPSLFLLLHGAAIQLLKSNGLLQARNELSYSAGGSSFIRSNKSNYYLAWMNSFASQYTTTIQNEKIAANIKRGWGSGGVRSEYDRLGHMW